MVGYLRPSFLKPDIAVDLGTAWVRVAFGAHGLHMVPSVFEGRNALKAGVVVDRYATAGVLSPLLAKVRRFGVLPPRAVACVPSDVSSQERAAVRECVLKAGAANVCIVPEPLAAAVGAGVDVASPFCNMILDIGEGVTDCAVIRSGKIVGTHALRVGCSELRKALIDAAPHRMRHSLDREGAERLLRRIDIGHKCVEAYTPWTSPCEEVDGDIKYEDRYRKALDPLVEKMIGVALTMLSQIDPTLACEIIENGIWLSGGGSLLKGMGNRLEKATRIRVNTSAHPLDAVVRGAHAMLPIITTLNNWNK